MKTTDVISEFEQMLTEMKLNKENDMFVLKCYWDYRDEMPIPNMYEILTNYMHDLTLEQNVENYLWEQDWLPDYVTFEHYWEQFIHLDSRATYNTSENRELLADWWAENTIINYNVDVLLNHTQPWRLNDLTLYFKGYEGDWEKYKDVSSVDPDFNLSEFLEDVDDSQIAWLIKTQGYEPQDLLNYNVRINSSFLTELYEEVFDYYTEIKDMQLIAIPSSSDWHAIEQLMHNQTGIIKAGTAFGLYNRIDGSGCGLAVETLKDIKLSHAQNLQEVDFLTRNQFGNYSPDVAYGLVRESIEQLATAE